MLNQLPKNQNQNSFNPLTAFNNEKHLNLIEAQNLLETSQEQRISNFILGITLTLGIFTSIVSYLNLSNIDYIEFDETTNTNINFLKSKETEIYELNNEVEYIRSYAEAKNSIKIKQSIFFKQLNDLFVYFGRPPIQSINYSNVENKYSFEITLFTKEQNFEQKIKEYPQLNQKINLLKINSIEKISNTGEIKYSISGEIDGR